MPISLPAVGTFLMNRDTGRKVIAVGKNYLTDSFYVYDFLTECRTTVTRQEFDGNLYLSWDGVEEAEEALILEIGQLLKFDLLDTISGDRVSVTGLAGAMHIDENGFEYEYREYAFNMVEPGRADALVARKFAFDVAEMIREALDRIGDREIYWRIYPEVQVGHDNNTGERVYGFYARFALMGGATVADMVHAEGTQIKSYKEFKASRVA